MYPFMLHDTVSDDPGFTRYRDADDLFPERQGTPPDPLGSLFVRFLSFLDDRWDAIRGYRTPEATTMAEQSSGTCATVLQ